MGRVGAGVVRHWHSLNSMLEQTERRVTNQVSDWWQHYGAVVCCVLLGSVAAYGIDLFTPSLSIDEEVYTVRSGPVVQWLEQDRWGMFLFSRAMPQPVLPFISLLIGLVANAVASVLAVSLLGLSGRMRATGAGLLAACTPVLCFLMHFDTSQAGFFMGLLVAVISVRFFVRGSASAMLAGWLMLVFAVSVYQSVALVALVVYLGWLLNRRILADRPEDSGEDLFGLLRNIFVFGLWFGAALAGHKGSAAIVRALFARDGGYVLVDSVYDGSFLGRYEPNAPIGQMADLLLGRAWYMGWQTPFLIGVCVVVIAARLVGLNRSLGVRLLGAGVLASVVIAPFLLPLATGSRWPTRTMMAVPMMLAVLLFTATGVRARVHAWVLSTAAVVTLFHFAVSNNRLMYADHLRWMADRDMGVRVRDRLDAERSIARGHVRLAMIGQPHPTSSAVRFREETIGGSIFEWEGGNPYRVALLLRYLGAEAVSGTTHPADYRRAVEAAASMSVWPAQGSMIVFEDGLVVVKFGDPSSTHLRYAGEAP